VKVTSCLVLTKAVKQPGLTSHHAAFRVGEFEVAISGGIWVAIREAAELIESLTSDNPGYIARVSVVELYWVLTSAYELARHQVAQAL
jgi:hypothetical protein